MRRSWIRRIAGGLSLTTAMFVFQACYGTPQDFGLDFQIEGQVRSQVTGLPVKGIKVSIANNLQYQYTDENGKFSFYTEMMENVRVVFEDIDQMDNGNFISKDIVVNAISEKVVIDIDLEEK